jgi:hypothetical protein
MAWSVGRQKYFANRFAALKKESQDRLKAYQHLFYLLQTHPDYLARWVAWT